MINSTLKLLMKKTFLRVKSSNFQKK